MKKQVASRRKGVVLVVVLLLIVVAGLTLSESIEIENTLIKQQNEVYLKSSLADLRLAMEIACKSPLVREKPEFLLFVNDPGDSEKLRGFIRVLLKEGILPSHMATTSLSLAELDLFIPRDPTVDPLKWAKSSSNGSVFWKTKTNLIENSSFEALSTTGGPQKVIASWTYDPQFAGPDENDFPTILNVCDEDLDRVTDRYNSQNRFGRSFAPGRGTSIRCTAN